MGLGFTPLYAAGLSLIANTAPVAFGAIGTPILTLAAVTGIPAQTLGMMAGRQLPFVSLIVPAWLVVTMSGWRGLRGVWPAVLVCGGSFAVVQFSWSNFVGPELVDIAGGLVSIGALALFCACGSRATSGSSRRAAARCRSARAFASSRCRADGSTVAIARGLARVDAVAVSERRGDSLGARAGEGVPERRPARARRVPRGRAARRQPVLSPTWNVPFLHRAVFRDYPVVPAARRSARGSAIRRIATRGPRPRCSR